MLVHSSRPCQSCQTPPSSLTATLDNIDVLIFYYNAFLPEEIAAEREGVFYIFIYYIDLIIKMNHYEVFNNIQWTN